MKNFQHWSEYQAELEQRFKPRRAFYEGQIWRCAIGINTGIEIDGKSARYWRPVIIVRKFDDELLFGVPLTRSPKGQPYHLPLTVKGKTSYAVINQLRALDARRLQQHLATLDPVNLARVRSAIRELFEEP